MSMHKQKNADGSFTTTIMTRHQTDDYDTIDIHITIYRDKKIVSESRSTISVDWYKDTIDNLTDVFNGY